MSVPDWVFTAAKPQRHIDQRFLMPKCRPWFELTILLVGVLWLPSRSAAAAAVEPCRIQGVAEPNIDTNIVDAQGKEIARLTGSATPIEIKQWPTMPSVLAQIATSIPEVRGFRIEGLVSVRALGIRTKTRIEVVPSMVWLAPGIRLDGVVRIGNDILVEKRLDRDFAQTLVARARCAMLGFSESQAEPEPLPPKARAVRFDQDQLQLFTAASETTGPRITMIRHPSTNSVQFFVVKTDGNWVSLRYDGEVAITAWAKTRAITALPVGEMQDQSPRSKFERAMPKLGLGGTPQLARAPQNIALRAQASTSAPPIGEVESDAEFYVIEVVSGWASVVPRSLGVMPAPNRQFWIEAQALRL